MLKARQPGAGAQAPWAPAPIAEVQAAIARDQPAVVFALHVETASGRILPDACLRAVADAVHAVGGLFVLDCIASGAMWVDMRATGVDVLISAPQKGWSSSPCCAMGHAQRTRPHGHRRHRQHQLCRRLEKVAADHGNL
ncbi:Serine-pyruvate aminotransferase/archaeal aspartate aminotransferase [Polaromonas sp. CG9_12]|nr:Serine-pyruvate aminotransferase/archaeal aspartate aminotransferase [Polaromonas sp. CG9_12]